MRRRATLPDGWVRPHWLETGLSQGDRLATPVGTIDSGPVAAVDPRGLVVPASGGWSLDWWVGAEDRWHVPAMEPSSRVSQELVGAAPVVETSLRVPGGHATHRCWATRLGGRDVVVVEIENRSAVPFVVAPSLRPYDLARVATVDRARLDGCVLTFDGGAVTFGRPPAFVAVSDGTIDAAEAVFANTRRTPEDVGSFGSRHGLAALSMVFPLPHTAVLRVALGAGVDVAALPNAEQVSRGWSGHVGRAARVLVPDERLSSTIEGALGALLLHAGEARAYDDTVVVAALERWGFGNVVARLADARGYRVVPGAEFVVPDAIASVAGGPLHDAASTPWVVGWPPGREHPGRPAARFLLAARYALLRERPDGIDLLPGFDEGWLGQGVEVHDAPTSLGPISFAVRWHGSRPAFLWEGPEGVVLRAPCLDPSWISTEAQGEALLGPVEPAGGLPKVYRSVRVGPNVDEPGGSFL